MMQENRNIPLLSFNGGKSSVLGSRQVNLGPAKAAPKLRPLSNMSNNFVSRASTPAVGKDYVLRYVPKRKEVSLQPPKIVGYAGHIPSIRDTCAESFKDSLTSAKKDSINLQKGGPLMLRRPASAPLWNRADSVMSTASTTSNTSMFSQGFRSSVGNNSNINFGDDRMWVPKSTNQMAYGKKAEEAVLMSPEKRAQVNSRQRKYDAAKRKVSPNRINKIKNEMHQKIDQSMTGGPFQLRRAFRQFDRDASGLISLSHFRATLKDYFSMAVSEDEITALYAVYDTDCNGGIDYKEFATLIMEPDFVNVTQW